MSLWAVRLPLLCWQEAHAHAFIKKGSSVPPQARVVDSTATEVILLKQMKNKRPLTWYKLILSSNLILGGLMYFHDKSQREYFKTDSSDSPSISFWDEFKTIKVCCILKKDKKRDQTTQAMRKRSQGAHGPVGCPVPHGRGRGDPMPLCPSQTLLRTHFLPRATFLESGKRGTAPSFRTQQFAWTPKVTWTHSALSRGKVLGKVIHTSSWLINQHLLPTDEDLGNAVTHSINWCY